jgi:hypothetical protein
MAPLLGWQRVWIRAAPGVLERHSTCYEISGSTGFEVVFLRLMALSSSPWAGCASCAFLASAMRFRISVAWSLNHVELLSLDVINDCNDFSIVRRNARIFMPEL